MTCVGVTLVNFLACSCYTPTVSTAEKEWKKNNRIHSAVLRGGGRLGQVASFFSIWDFTSFLADTQWPWPEGLPTTRSVSSHFLLQRHSLVLEQHTQREESVCWVSDGPSPPETGRRICLSVSVYVCLWGCVCVKRYVSALREQKSHLCWVIHGYPA